MPEPSLYLIHDQVKDAVVEYRRTVEALEGYFVASGRGQESIKDLAVELQKERENLKEIIGRLPLTDAEGLTLKTSAVRQGLNETEQKAYVRAAAEARLVLGANTEQVNNASAAFVGDLRSNMGGLTYALDLATLAQKKLQTDGDKVLSVMTGAQLALQNLRLQPHQVAALSMAAMGRFREDGTLEHQLGFGADQTTTAFQALGGLLNRVKIGDAETIAKLQAAGVDEKTRKEFVNSPADAIPLLLKVLGEKSDDDRAGYANSLFGDQSGPIIAEMAQNEAALAILTETAKTQSVGSLISQADRRAQTVTVQEAIKANLDGRSLSAQDAQARKNRSTLAEQVDSGFVGGLIALVLERLLIGRGRGGGIGPGPGLGRGQGQGQGPRRFGMLEAPITKPGDTGKALKFEKFDLRGYMQKGMAPRAGGLGGPLGGLAVIIDLLMRTWPTDEEFERRLEKMRQENKPASPPATSPEGPDYSPFGLPGILGNPKPQPQLHLDPIPHPPSPLGSPGSVDDGRHSSNDPVPGDQEGLSLMQREPEAWGLLQKLEGLPVLIERLGERIERVGAMTQEAMRNPARVADVSPSLDYSVRHGGLPVSYALGV